MHRSSTGGPCNCSSVLLYFLGLRRAGVAQLVEHLICNQRVGGSNPSASSAKIFRVRGKIPIDCGRQVPASRSKRKSVFCLCKLRGCTVPFLASIFTSIPPCGRVGEWLKPADCKSAAPCGLRRFESSPVHHLVALPEEELRREPGEIAMFFAEVLRSECRGGRSIFFGGTGGAACGKQDSPG